MLEKSQIMTVYSITSAFCLFAVVLCIITSVEAVSPEPDKDTYSKYEDIEIEPLRPEECGQCHSRFYYMIKNQGGRHRIDCRQCHVQFHIYRPGKVPYKEILPKCEACHEQVHGEELTQCTGCHSEVHTPMDIPVGPALEHGCYICHPKADEEMNTYITQHTELYCSGCHHTRHRTIPECIECHQPHPIGMTGIGCLICHPPHKALQIIYPEDIPQESCIGCHQNASQALKGSGTKHADVSCTKCHPEKHRAIMKCEGCHGEPHDAAMLQEFRICGQCHGIAHTLDQR